MNQPLLVKNIKQYNRSRILQAIQNGYCSRQDIANFIDLTPAAVSILVGELIVEGVLIETGEQVSVDGRGRKRTQLSLNPFYKYLLAVAIEHDDLTISLATLDKQVIASTTYRYYKPDIQFVYNYIEKTITNMLKDHNIHKEQVLGLGVGIVGMVSPEEGRSLHAYELWNTSLPIRDILQERLAIPVVIDNNVRALALAELEERKDQDNLVFVKYGPGIGSSFIMNHDIYSGSSLNALELGHTVVDFQGKACSCGQKGCLETLGSVKAIYHELEQVFQETTLFDSNHPTILSIQIEDIMNAYLNEDTIVQSIVNKAITYFAIGLINIVKILDPSKVILYGDFYAHDVWYKRLIQTIKNNGCDCEQQFEQSNLPKNKCIGALSLVRKRLLLDTGAYM